MVIDQIADYQMIQTSGASIRLLVPYGTLLLVVQTSSYETQNTLQRNTLLQEKHT